MTNIYAGLDISDNEEEVKKAPKPVKAKTEGTKDKAAAPAANAAKTEKKDSKSQAKPVKAAAATDAAPATSEPADDSKENRKRGGNGKTQKHGDKYQKDGKRAPKRDFDRRSATGRGKEVSKDGRGPYGSGNVQQEAQDAEKHPEAALEEDKGAAAESEAAAPVVEVVDNTLSYDDFLRKRQESRAASAVLIASKATRSVDSNINGVKAVDERHETYIAPKTSKSAGDSKKEQRSTGKSHIVDTAFKFESTAPVEHRRFDDDRRGGDRRSKTGSAPHAKKSTGVALDSSDFPAL